ncbi:MAG: cyclase family protein [Acidobacteriia bacterium]|nr:cyclase family protein [Terriglobia bacterium]
MAQWQKGKGWGWIWGAEDEIGALNAITPQTVLEALRLIRHGKTADLGLVVDRSSFRWPGHAATEVMSYRTPSGERAAGDDVPGSNDTRWHSAVVFTCDHIGTHLDGLAHITVGKGADTHWYNGFQEPRFGGDFGVMRAGADKFPPIIARGILLDVAGWKGVEALPSSYAITPDDLRQTLAWENVELRTGDVVLVRTGTGRFWGETGADHEAIHRHDTAGISLESAHWLIEEFGPIVLGSDTTTVEVVPFVESVHAYCLVEQGVPLAELHYLEQLATEKVYEFAYVAMTNKIKGATAGIAMRPVAIY